MDTGSGLLIRDSGGKIDVMQTEDFVRLANNFYNFKGMESLSSRINTDIELTNFLAEKSQGLLPKYKVAFVFICLNPLYWEFAPEMVKGAKDFFLPGHKTDFFFWTDIPEKDEDIRAKMTCEFQKILGLNPQDHNLIYNDITIGQNYKTNLNQKILSVMDLRKTVEVNIIPTEPIEWPFPTLKRYHLFLQEEEKLKDYDYIFYCDTDMRFVDIVGDEILGNGLTAAPHPGYAVRKEYYPPYEPNQFSASYIQRPGRVVMEGDKKRFRPEYYAGGFQGGKSKQYIEAMKVCRELIDTDLKNGYIPIWNDETVWNKYLSENPPDIMLTPSYIYPDSLINEYYIPLWGQNYQPKLITLTKWFSLSKESGQNLQQILKQ